MVKGIIFDFNGTMIFDAHLHEKAWVKMIKKHNNSITEQEIINYIHGRTNDKIIRHFIGDVSKEEFQKLSDEKEKKYQQLVKEEKLWFVEGTEELLDQLVARDIPFTIATSSPKINIDFYFSYFELGRWFSYEKIIYDDGTFPGKPDPAIYQQAAASLGLAPEDCAVIEDAMVGVEAANRANIGQVFIMSRSDEQQALYENSAYEFKAIINNFVHFLKDAIERT